MNIETVMTYLKASLKKTTPSTHTLTILKGEVENLVRVYEISKAQEISKSRIEKELK